MVLVPFRLYRKDRTCATNRESVDKCYVILFLLKNTTFSALAGPFRGLNGTIQIADTISDDLEELFCFYLVALEGTQIKEPIWFEHEEVELLTSPLVALEA